MTTHFNDLQPAEDVTVSGSSAQSTAAPAGCTHARICATVDVRYRKGTNPTAVTTDTLLPAGLPEFIPLAAGLKLAVIQESTGGKFNITFLGA